MIEKWKQEIEALNHEWRNRLAAIKAFIELIELRGLQEGEEEKVEAEIAKLRKFLD